MLSCTNKTKKGVIIVDISGAKEITLTEEEKEAAEALWENDIFTQVQLGNGDTILAAINIKDLETRIMNDSLDVEVIVDGKNDNFYFIKK